MPLAPATILGGLPVIAEVTFGYDSGSPYSPPEAWAEVQAIYWCKKGDKPGKPIPQHLYDKAEAYDPSFSNLIDTVQDWLVYRDMPDREPTTLT